MKLPFFALIRKLLSTMGKRSSDSNEQGNQELSRKQETDLSLGGGEASFISEIPKPRRERGAKDGIG